MYAKYKTLRRAQHAVGFYEWFLSTILAMPILSFLMSAAWDPEIEGYCGPGIKPFVSGGLYLLVAFYSLSLFVLAPAGGDSTLLKTPEEWGVLTRVLYRLSPCTWVGFRRNHEEEAAWEEAAAQYHPNDPTKPSRYSAVWNFYAAFAKVVLVYLEKGTFVSPLELGLAHLVIFVVFFVVVALLPPFENRTVNAGALFLVAVEVAAAASETHAALSDPLDLAPGKVFLAVGATLLLLWAAFVLVWGHRRGAAGILLFTLLFGLQALPPKYMIEGPESWFNPDYSPMYFSDTQYMFMRPQPILPFVLLIPVLVQGCFGRGPIDETRYAITAPPGLARMFSVVSGASPRQAPDTPGGSDTNESEPASPHDDRPLLGDEARKHAGITAVEPEYQWPEEPDSQWLEEPEDDSPERHDEEYLDPSTTTPIRKYARLSQATAAVLRRYSHDGE